MAFEIGRATWVADLSDSDLARRVGDRTFDRGQEYAAQRKVRSLVSRADGGMLLGTIDGSRTETYQTIIEGWAAPSSGVTGVARWDWTARCSCPVGDDCKHAVALLITARESLLGGIRSTDDGADDSNDTARDGPDARPDVPRWQEIFGDLPELVPTQRDPRETRARDGLVPAGLVIEPALAPGNTTLDWTVRPTRRTKTGTWTRTRLSWAEVLPRWRSGTRLLEAHEKALERIDELGQQLEQGRAHRASLGGGALAAQQRARRYASDFGSPYGRESTAGHSLGLAPEMIEALRAAEHVGVALLTPEDLYGTTVFDPITGELFGEAGLADAEASTSSVTIGEPLGLDVVIQRVDPLVGGAKTPQSDLLVTLAFTGEGARAVNEPSGGTVHLIGEPVAGVILEHERHLTLYALEQALGLDAARLRTALEGVVVAEADREAFVSTLVPRLQRRARVRSSVPLPLVPGDGGDGADPEGHDPEVTVFVHATSDLPGVIHLDLGFAYDGRKRDPSERARGVGGVWSTGVDRQRIGQENDALTAARSVQAIPGAVRSFGGSVDGSMLSRSVRLSGLDAISFFDTWLPALEADEHVTVVVEEDLAAYEEITSAPTIRLGMADRDADDTDNTDRDEPSDWFDLSVRVEVEGEEVPIGTLIAAIRSHQKVMWLESGSVFRLDRADLSELTTLLSEAQEIVDVKDGRLQLNPAHVDLWEELTALGIVDQQSERWQRAMKALGSTANSTDETPVPASLQAELRPYQLDGYRWLSRLWDADLGGILADDMGLGKTIQLIATLLRAHDAGELSPQQPVLVVAPTSVVGTWLQEFARFAPEVPVVALDQTTRARGTSIAEASRAASVVVTSYAVLRLDAEQFQAVSWRGLILDEAQFVKNRQSKTHIALRKIGAPFTIAVTGTPLENSLMDLWALLSLTAPGLYPRPDVFTKNYRRPIESGKRPELLALLRKRIRPLMLRRTKESVALDLPPKQIQVLSIPHHPVHGQIYEKHLARERQRVLGLLEDPEANRVAILAALTRLRQMALDPALVDEAYDGKAMAAKIAYLVEQLRELAAEGHRALVFSQFTGFLRRVEAALVADGLRTCYLDGATSNRQEVIRSFRDGQAAAFLISLKAGGFGLTLTEADYVFVLDPWWNPAAEAQAIDRAHRIGQTKQVMVYRLVSEGTIEEKVVALQERKRDLFKRVVEEGGELSGAITAQDVKDLLALD